MISEVRFCPKTQPSWWKNRKKTAMLLSSILQRKGATARRLWKVRAQRLCYWPSEGRESHQDASRGLDGAEHAKFNQSGIQEDLFFSGAKRNGVFASDDVFSCGATSDEGRVSARACSQAQNHDSSTKVHRAKDISRGVFYVFFDNRNFNDLALLANLNLSL